MYLKYQFIINEEITDNENTDEREELENEEEGEIEPLEELEVMTLFSMQVYSTFGGGDGSEGNPYLISTLAQLKAIPNYTEDHFKITADINANNDWTTIGYFYGTLDGGNFTISNLNAPLFSQVGSSSYPPIIKNVTVSCNMSVDTIRVGGITGEFSYGTIENCNSTGTISSNTSNARVGGITGYNSCTVKNCSNTGAVSCTGGIAGTTGSRGKIMNCYNAGTASGSQYVGGIAGYNFSDTTNCYWLTTTASAMAGWAGGTNENNFSYNSSGVFTTDGVSYSSNINVGTVTVTIEGTGNYSGSFTKTFNITVRTLEESDFDNIGDIIYTGSEIEPDITSISLHSDTDYEITSYVDNVDVSTGIATVTIIGKANNYLKIINTTYKVAKFIIKYIGALSTVNMGSSVTSIGDSVFYECSSLSIVTVKVGSVAETYMKESYPDIVLNSN